MPTDRQTDREVMERLMLLKLAQKEMKETGESTILDEYIANLELSLTRP